MTEPDTETTPEQPETPAESQDWLLTVLVRMANNIGLGFGVTLCVGGVLVSGTLVSGRQWTDALIAEMRTRGHGNAAEALAGNLEGLLREQYPEPQLDREDEFPHTAVGYIHLTDAHYISGTNQVPSDLSVAWRGRLSEVDGWSLGALSASN
jgi:hypothetical protein